MTNSKPIILAAGGTGGHLYPAEALAQELLNRGHNVIIITDKRGAAFQKLGDKVRIDCVRAATFKAGIFSKIKALIDIEIGILQSLALLMKYRPALIVGFGGYPSFPAVIAGQIMNYPTILHEQNAVLGKANVWLAYAAKKIAVSLPDTRGIKSVDQPKIVLTGNPVRADICALRDWPYPMPNKTLNIFITGGSQAAKVFGEIVPQAVAKLPQDIRSKLHIVQQSKEPDTAGKYRAADVTSDIRPFFDDMSERLAACHLFIGRSGASTVAEIAVVGRPAIFVPYPGHADQQQLHNAELIAQKGGGWIIPQDKFTPDLLAEYLERFANTPVLLEKAAAAAKDCGQPEAVKNLADLVEKTLADG
jgi:UDP-N-acetylglucosamine--N-acetylmuramyl-(pentapeptide) pyrophosphoryl-undecaprenol N-acetylglucosamine transferase